MDTRHLQYFVALAETLHFGKAAARMNMTQPPFSRQIANLEDGLGARLVERNSRHVRLTAAGEHFLKDARRILEDFDKACRDARWISEGLTGELRLGFMMHAADHIVPALVSRFRKIRPDVRIRLREIIPGDIRNQLLQGEIDAAVCFAGPQISALRSLPLLTDRLVLIVPAGHRLAGRAQVSAGDFADEEIIATPASVSGTLRNAIDGYFHADGRVARTGLEPALQHSIVRLVAAGLGVAMVPESICAGSGDDIAVIPLTSPPRLEVVLLVPAPCVNPAVAALEQALF